MASIVVKNLSFSYDYEDIFKDVSFTIDTDWKLGLIGRNGKGKTTLLKILQNELPYQGTIYTTVEFSYFPFPVKNPDRMTIDILQEIAPDCEEWQIRKELNTLELEEEVLYRGFDTLSNGEQIKMLLASMFLRENQFLLIDEPTNHLDAMARKTISKYLNHKKGFIVVSHDRDFLDSCVDHILSINNTGIEIRQGDFSTWKENKERKDNFELEQNENIKKEIKRLKQASSRNEKWSDAVERSKTGALDKGYVGHQAAKMMKRAKVIEKRVEKQQEQKEELLKDIEKAEPIIMKPLTYGKHNLVYISHLQIHYGEKTVFNNVNLEVNKEDRVAIVGKNGSGKSSLLKLIAGRKIAHMGEMGIGKQMKISYVKQDVSDLSGNLKDFAKKNKVQESILKSTLQKLGFRKEEFDRPIEEYSEGQKKKVALAKSICEEADLYIWDEPLNFMDILSRMQIEEMLLKYKPTLVFVEHDEAFIRNVATKIVEIK